MKALYFILSIVSFVLTYVGLDLNWEYVALAVGTAVAGSLVLAYIRPELTVWRQVIKGLIATIVGLIFGAAGVEYFVIEKPEYVGLIFFSASLLALIVIRAFVGLFERKADSLTVLLMQRIFNVDLRTDNKSQKYSRVKRERE